MSILIQFLRMIKRKLCIHENYKVLDRLGPTYRGKLWVACKCEDCGQYFVYEAFSGKRYLMDGPGFGLHVV